LCTDHRTAVAQITATPATGTAIFQSRVIPPLARWK
jgi:hypothetical protein